MRVKKLVKVRFSEGGGVQLDFILKGVGGWVAMIVAKKLLCYMRVLNLLEDLFVSCLKVLAGVGANEKPLVRTDNSSSVNI